MQYTRTLPFSDCWLTESGSGGTRQCEGRQAYWLSSAYVYLRYKFYEVCCAAGICSSPMKSKHS